jgi:RHS repeat-associated protein
MRARRVVVRQIRAQDSLQVPFVEHHGMIETFTTDHADQAFDIGILPRRARREWDILDADWAGRFGRTTRQAWDKYSPSFATLDQINYGYDYEGNRLWREDVVAASNSVNQDEYYTYDGLQRLATFQRGDLNGTYTGISATAAKEQDWTLDQLGNWSAFVKKTGTTTDLNQSRTHNEANELTYIDSSNTHVAEDAAGNMTKVPKPNSWTAHFDLTYDPWNRLVGVKDGSTPIEGNEYDGLGRRIVHVDSAASVTYDDYYNESWQMLEKRKSTSSTYPLAQYVWHPYYVDALAVRYCDSATSGSPVTQYYCQDANYNVTAVVNASGTVLDRTSYTPYGEALFLDPTTYYSASSSAIGNNILCTGRERDAETGIQLNRERYYHAQLGRWLRRDPKDYKGSKWNLYEYVSDEPITGLDPQGTDCPGCDDPAGAANSNPCYQACCAQHDKCYDDHGCSAWSWGWNVCGVLAGAGEGPEGSAVGAWLAGQLSSCASCNNDVVDCFAQCTANQNHMNGKPQFYCKGKPGGGKHDHSFIRIPGDYGNIDDAKKDCCNPQ